MHDGRIGTVVGNHVNSSVIVTMYKYLFNYEVEVNKRDGEKTKDHSANGEGQLDLV